MHAHKFNIKQRDSLENIKIYAYHIHIKKHVLSLCAVHILSRLFEHSSLLKLLDHSKITLLVERVYTTSLGGEKNSKIEFLTAAVWSILSSAKKRFHLKINCHSFLCCSVLMQRELEHRDDIKHQQR